MYKVIYIKLLILFLFTILNVLYGRNVNASYLEINNSSYSYEYHNNIYIYKNDILNKVVMDSYLLDMNDKYVLYNSNNEIYLYDFGNQLTTHIVSGYNANLSNEYVVYESTFNQNYKCRNYISNEASICNKLYIYNIETKESNYINIMGNDIYLNDFNDGKIVYNSIHYNDLYCTTLCSFVGIYDIYTKESVVLNNYENIKLNVSGNGYIYKDIVLFESSVMYQGCSNSQIFKYNLLNSTLEVLSDNEYCFYYDLEIIDFKNDFVIFDMNDKLYVYSIENKKYIELNINSKKVKIHDAEIIYLEDDSLFYSKIDNIPPQIDNKKEYTILLGKEGLFKNNLLITDNLTHKDNIDISILTEVKVGKSEIKIKACDTFLNCSIDTVFVNVLISDEEAPKIYIDEIIYLPRNQLFDINDHGYAYDNIDGMIKLKSINNINYNERKAQYIFIEAIDSSGNVATIMVEVIIYGNEIIFRAYYLTLILILMLVIIIYIFRFKKRL